MRCAVAFSVALCFLLGCATKPLHELDWVEVRTPHFEIVSSLSDDETRELARDAELFHAATEFVMGTPLRPPAVPTQVSTGSLVATYDPGTLGHNKKCCWRVDVVHAGGTETGTDYEFTTAEGPPPPPEYSGGIGYASGAGGITYDDAGMAIK